VNCAITVARIAKCWDLDGFLKVPTDLGSVTSIDSSYELDESDEIFYRVCAVQTSGSIKCWDTNSSSESITVNIPAGFSQVAVGPGHICAVQNNGLSSCWGDGTLGEIDSELDPVGGESGAFQPAPSEPKLVKTADGIEITVTQLARNFPSEPITRTIVDVKTGIELCRSTSRTWTGCTIHLDHIDREFRVASQSTNRFGSGPVIISKPLRYCGPGQTRIETTLSNDSPASGEIITISGQVMDSCETATQVLIRQKAYGKSWGGWKKHSLASGSFQINQKVSTGTDFQFRTLSGNRIDAQGATRVLPSYTDIGLVVTGKSSKTSQGFKQGGKLTYNIYAPSFYNGRCTMLAETEYAFNFALTHMGSETKVGYFTVKNGRGTGTLTLRWNGEVRARVLCESPAFSNSVVSERYLIFRANF
jgi:hypothetical protein